MRLINIIKTNEQAVKMGTFAHICYFLLLVALCSQLNFEPVSTLNSGVQLNTFIALGILSILLYPLVMPSDGPKAIDIIAIGPLPFGIYGILYYHTAFPVLTICCLCAGIMLASIFFERDYEKEEGRRVTAAFLRNGLKAFSVCLIFIIVASTMFDGEVANTKDLKLKGRELDYTLTSIEWDKMGIEDRLQVMVDVSNDEAKMLGIPNCKISLATLPDYVGGNTRLDNITINAEQIKHFNLETAIEVIVHETYHAYQFRCTQLYKGLDKEWQDLFIFRQSLADRFAENYDHYHPYGDSKKAQEEYFNQFVEVTAREYAERVAPMYLEKLKAQSI